MHSMSQELDPNRAGSQPGWRALIGLWLLCSVLGLIAYKTGSVVVDGFQSLGAVAGAAGPGRLRWPLLGGFMGYDQTWGFHWFGWPYLRSLLLPLLPWRPSTDFTLACLIWGVAAWLIARLAERLRQDGSGIWTGLLAASAPGFMASMQSYRPEILTALVLVVVLVNWEGKGRSAVVWRAVGLVLLPMLHPLGSVVPGCWLAATVLLDGRQSGWKAAFVRNLPKGLSLGIGALLLVAWYGFQPTAWAQFQLNVRCQRLLVEGLGAGWLTFFRWGLGGLSSIFLLSLFVPASLWGLRSVLGGFSPALSAGRRLELLASIGVLVTLAFNIAAKNPNPLHLVAAMPLAAWLCQRFVQSACGRFPIWVGRASLSAVLLFFWVYPLRQGLASFRHQGVGYRDELSGVVRGLPQAKRVFIPVALWEAVITDPTPGTEYRFSTFPNLLTQAERADYERTLAEDARTGDLLVWDALQDHGGIFNFVAATALKHQVLRPPDDPEHWERLDDRILDVTYSRGQPTTFEVYRRR
jgi:hypothetical protein